MRRAHLGWPGTLLPSALAALATWVSLWAWAGFVESPGGYLVPTLGVVLLVAASGILLRSLRTPSLLVALAQVGLLSAWFTHQWAPDAALGGWIPTPASLAETREILQESALVAQAYAAPVADSVPQVLPLLIVSGAAVAVLVDFLACGLRRVPVAGLPLLALYTAPVPILSNGVPWWVFAASALAFLALLASDEGLRLATWGRRVGHGDKIVDTGTSLVSAVSVRTSARRIGLTATGLAVVTPLVIPTLSTNLLGGPGIGGDGPGDSVAINNPMVTLRRDLVRDRDVDLLRITTADANPSYLRISVLDTFDGSAWRPSQRDIPSEQRAEGRLPDPPGLAPTVRRREVDYRIQVADEFTSTWLPAPYPVTTIDAPGDWRYDVDTFDFVSATEGENAAGLSYSLSALEVAPTAEDLIDAAPAPEEVFTPYTELPENLPALVPRLAREITAGLDSRFEKAVRLQQWFREDGGFEYSLEREPGNGSDDLVAFLSPGEGGRVGYCEQFAASMAVMGRTLGIPSRVAVGFLRADRVADTEYVYSSYDLHAWPEMYFDDAGWVRFEPTPSTRASGVPGYTSDDAGTPQPTDVPSAPVPTDDAQGRDLDRLDPGQGGAAADDGSGGTGAGAGFLGGLALAGLLLSPRAARAVVRRSRWAKARRTGAGAEAGWSELRDVASDLRLRWDDAVTVRIQARRLAQVFGRPHGAGQDVTARRRGVAANPAAAEALRRIVHDVEVSRYGRQQGALGRSVDETAADVELVETALRDGAPSKTRRAATWLPASLVRNGVWRSTLTAGNLGPTPQGEVDRAT